MSQETSASPVRRLIEAAGRIRVFAAGLTGQAGSLPPLSEERQALADELDAARGGALGVNTEPFLSFSEWQSRVEALVSACRTGLDFDRVGGDFADRTQTLSRAIAAVDGVATPLEAGETLPNDHPAPSGDAEFLAALAEAERELNEAQLTREREAAREQTYAQWRVRHERLSQLLLEVGNVWETAAGVEGFWELWAERVADLGRLLNELGLGHAIDAFSMEAADPRSAAARTVVVTAIRMACRGGRSDSIAPLLKQVSDQQLLPHVRFWVHHIAHHLLAAWSARWQEDPAAQEGEAACSSADWRIVGDAPEEEVSRFPQPACGRFVHVLPPPTRDGTAGLKGETRYVVPHPSLALCWGNGRGQEVIGRCDGYLVRTRPADAQWLPEGWRMEWCPIGWTLPHIEHWFGHALRRAERDNRPDIPSGAAVSSSDPPTPRELVAHAHLIVRHLNGFKEVLSQYWDYLGCDSPTEIGPGPADTPTIVGEGSVLNAPQPAQGDTAPHDAGRIDTAGGNAYVFRLSGDLWELRFGEESGFARDSEGLRRIARLLARPDQSIGALELMGSDLSRLDTSRSYQDDLDQEALKSCRDELKAIEKQIRDAAALGNEEEAYRLAERREEIQKNLRRGEKPAGKRRRNLDSSSPREKARKAVGNSIRKAYKVIRKAGLPSLADYLEKRLQLGTDCSYYPSGPPLPWQL